MKTPIILFLLFALLTQTARANPTPLVAGCVNPITGEYTPLCEDLVIKGAHPIYLTRTYDPSTYTWSFTNRPPKETHPTGNHTFTTYDAQGRITTIYTTNPSEDKTYAWARFSYPDAHTLTLTTSDARELTYTDYPKLSQVTQSNLPLETLTYASPSGPLQKRTFTSGKAHTIDIYRFRWNSIGTDYITITDPTDFRLERVKTLTTTKELRFFYHQGSTDVLDPENNKTTYTYDSQNNLLSITAYNTSGTLLNEKHYDTNPIDKDNIPTSHLTYLEGTDLITQELVTNQDTIILRRFFEYNEDNILIRTIVDDGSTSDKHNLTGVIERHITRITPKQNAPFINLPDVIEEKYLELSSNKESLLSKTVLSYDKHGQVIAKQIFDATNTPRYTLHYTYDSQGKLLSACNPLGELTTYDDHPPTNHTPPSLDDNIQITRDHQGRILSQDHYTPTGALISHEEFTYNTFHLLSKTDAKGTTHYLYDPAGRKQATITPQGKETYTYDALSRLSCTTTESLQIHKTYDLLNRLTEEIITDHQGHLLSKTSFLYDSAGNRSQITRWIGGKPSVTTYRYDTLGRLIEEIDPEGNITHTEYTDQTITRTSPLGLKTIDTYDNRGNRIHSQKKDAQGTTLTSEHFTYDTQGYLIEHTSPHKTLWEYDTDGKPITLTEAAHTSDPQITHHTYNADGHLQETLRPNGIRLTYTYTPQGLISSLHSSDDTVHYTYTYDTAGNLTSSYDEIAHQELTRIYDEAGNLIQETLPNGLTLQNTYDNQNRRTELTLPDTSIIHYTWGPLHLKEVTRFAPEKHLLYTHTYTSYDLSGNILEEEHIDSLGTTTRTLNARGHITHLSSPFFTQSATYAPSNNLTTTQIKTPISGYTANYTYDALGQLTQETAPTFHTHTYDTHHTPLLDDAPLPHLTYDALDRLITVIKKNDTKITYTYDALHRRTAKHTYTRQENTWHPTTTQYYIYDQSLEIGATNANREIEELRILGHTPTAEIGAAIAIELGNTPYLPIHDLFGNIIGLVHLQTRQLAALYQYTAFGEEKSLFSSPIQSPWRYASKRIDDETHLIYFGRRYYNSQTHRWLTPDPKGFTDTTNLYTYNNNAPLTHRDPYGLETLEIPTPNLDPLKVSLGNAIYFLYENFALLPFIREKGMAFGNALRGKSTTIEKEQTFLDSVGTGTLHPNHKTYFTNGILNDHTNATKSATAISKTLLNTTVSFAYSPSQGFLRDFLESLSSIAGFQTRASILLSENISKDIQDNPNVTILLLDHSQGNINANNALNNLIPEQQQHIERHAFGSPSYRCFPNLKADHHYFVRNDPIPWFNPYAAAHAHLYHNPNIHILSSCCNNPFLSHELLGPAYGPQLEILGAEYVNRYLDKKPQL